MIVRDVDGNIIIVNRSQCKDDLDYYQKLYKIRCKHIERYKWSCFPKQEIYNTLSNQRSAKETSEDIEC